MACTGRHAHGVCGRQSCRGLTLLELVLALALSVVLLFAVGLALRLYWRAFDVKRTNVEQAHLGRAILQKMKDDIHSAVQFTPVDLTGLESMTSGSSVAGALSSMAGGASGGGSGGGSTPGSGGGGSGGSGGGSGGSPMGSGSGGAQTSQPMSPSGSSGSGGGGATPSAGAATSGAAPSSAGASGGASTASSGNASANGGAAGQESGETAAVESTEGTPASVVGLYGSEYELQFDISRLPRVDEYAGGSPASMTQIPSDVKTVIYYVRSESATGSGPAMGGSAPAGSMEPSTSGQGRGLVRLEMDRAVNAFEESSGTSTLGPENARLLAEEVTSLAFRYWNGTEWATDWNSDEMGGLPLAIEIVITMADPNAPVPAGPPVQSFGAAAPKAASAATTPAEPTYRIVVNLPTASLPPPAEEPAEGTDPAAAEGGGTGASGGAGGGAGSGSGAGSNSGGASGTGGGTGSGAQTGAKK